MPNCEPLVIPAGTVYKPSNLQINIQKHYLISLYLKQHPEEISTIIQQLKKDADSFYRSEKFKIITDFHLSYLINEMGK